MALNLSSLGLFTSALPAPNEEYEPIGMVVGTAATWLGAKEAAIERSLRHMHEVAKDLDADAVVDVRIEATNWIILGHAFVATGTAVKVYEKSASRPPSAP